MTARGRRTRERAVLLRRSVHGDSDLILTFLGESRGKFTAYARGARRSKKRFGASLSWFTISDLEMSRRPNAEMFTLASADIVRAHTELAIDPATLSHASYATELVRELLAAEQVETAVFALLCEFYAVLRSHGASRFTLRSFELELLRELGMAPSFEACIGCGETELDRGAVLDAHGGGVACARCASGLRGQGTRQLTAEVRHLLAMAATQPSLSAAAETAAAHGPDSDAPFEQAAERGAQQSMTAILSRHLTRPLRSLEFIAKMNAASA